MAILTKEELEELYNKQHLTDKEIAIIKNTDRTNVVHLRKRFQIYTKQNTGVNGIKLVEKKLKRMNFCTTNLKEENKISEFDLLVNNEIKVEVIASKFDEKSKSFKFILTASNENRLKESDIRIRLNNGRTRKLYRKVVDYIICVGIGHQGNHYWVIPANDLPDTLQTLSLTPFSVKSKYQKYNEAWEQFKRVDE